MLILSITVLYSDSKRTSREKDSLLIDVRNFKSREPDDDIIHRWYNTHQITIPLFDPKKTNSPNSPCADRINESHSVENGKRIRRCPKVIFPENYPNLIHKS